MSFSESIFIRSNSIIGEPGEPFRWIILDVLTVSIFRREASHLNSGKSEPELSEPQDQAHALNGA